MNNSSKYLNTSIGIFRSLDVRLPHAEFVAAFKHFNASFITQLNSELRQIVNKKKVNTYDIALQPKYIFDPVYPFLKKTDFTPWLQFNNECIKAVCRSFAIYEIYEPYFFYSSQIADLASTNNVPLITEIWTSFPEHPSKYLPPYNFLVRNVINKTNLFILRTKKAHSYLQSFAIPENRKVMLYHGVNIKRFYPAKKTNETIAILFVGALAVHKGLDDLLAVFTALSEIYSKKLKLVVCGDGPLRKKVLQLSSRLPIDYKGLVSNNDLPAIYRSADIYCQPSKDYFFFGKKGGEEFAGYTFMEALASGLPIVATYCGGIPEIVGDKNILVTQGDRTQLYAALDTYIANHNLRLESGIQNRKRAEELFDLTKQVAAFEKVIKRKLM